MILITDDIARRLETAESIDAAGCAEAQCRITPGCDSAVTSIAGGVAVYCGVESPLTHAVGIGMHGPVTAEDMDEVEAFYRERGAAVVVDVCPHSDPTFPALVSARGYRILEFVNVMVCASPAHHQADASVEVRAATAHEEQLYVHTVIGGFFSRDTLTESEVRLGSTLFHMPCTSPFLAFLAGAAAGGGGISIRNRVASLFGDATKPDFRRRGVHSALIRARLAAAFDAGCDIVVAGSAPGSISQRNFERLGFRVAYTKVTMILE